MQQSLFAQWTRDQLQRLLSDAEIPIDSNRHSDIEYLHEIVSKYFSDAHQVASNAEQINTSIMEVYNQYINQASTLLTIKDPLTRTLKMFNEEVAAHAEAIQTTEDLSINCAEELEVMFKELQRKDCPLMFIGDVGAGKSTTINAILHKYVLPTGIIRTTGTILEIRYSQITRFFTLESDSSSAFVEQPVEFDRFPDKPSKALESFISSKGHPWPFVRTRLEYPLSLLANGIVFHDSHGINNADQLTDAVMQHMMICRAFICVINRDLTIGTRQILLLLIQLGCEPSSIFFIITHMDDYSTEEKIQTIDKLRNELLEIDPRFDHTECIIFNPRRTLDIFIRYGLHTKDYSELVLHFAPFFDRVLTSKLHSISTKIGETLRYISASLKTIRCQAQSTITTCEEQEMASNRRKKKFSNANERLKKKFYDMIVKFLSHACNKIVDELHNVECYSNFQQTINNIPFRNNIDEHLVPTNVLSKKTVIKDLNVYKVYLQREFERRIKNMLKPLLEQLTMDTVQNFGLVFCDDICLANSERVTFLEQLQGSSCDTMFKYYESILSQILGNVNQQLNKFSEVFVSYYLIGTPRIFSSIFDVLFRCNAETLTDDSRWSDFRQKLAQHFWTALITAADQELINAIDHSFSFSLDCTVKIMNIIERLYVGTRHDTRKNVNQKRQANALLNLYSRYNDRKIPSLRAILNRVHASRHDYWPLSADMISFSNISNNSSNDHTSSIVPARFQSTPTCQPILVHVRRLSGDFCAQHVCDQMRSNHIPRHLNILHYYGAYRKNNQVFFVTEPWQCSLRTASADVQHFSLEQRCQLAIELTEVCLHFKSPLFINHLTLDTLFIGQDHHVKLTLVTLKPLATLNNTDDDSEFKREIQISHALGLIFEDLFTHDKRTGPIGQALYSLAKWCCKKTKGNNSEQPTLRSILYMLKKEQINLQFMHVSPKNLIQRHRKRCGLIAIDGGGSRGIIAAKILERLQVTIGRPLWEVFHYGAGVSTGGLLTLSTLIRRTPPGELVPMYRKLCSKIFPPRLLPFFAYSAENLECELKKHFGEIRMDPLESEDPCVFVVTKQNYDHNPFLLRNYDVPKDSNTFKGESGWLCSDAARATTAAHTFFSPFVRDNVQYADGAMGFDNPVLVLFKEVALLQSISNSNDQHEESFIPDIDYIVSIGTGKMDGLQPPVGPPKEGIARVLETVQLAIQLLTDVENAHQQMQMLAKACGNIPYFRFNPKLPRRLPLDIRTESELNELVDLTEAYLDDDNTIVSQQIKELAAIVRGS